MLERSPECRYYILRRHMLNALCRAPGRESLLQQSLIYSPMRRTLRLHSHLGRGSFSPAHWLRARGNCHLLSALLAPGFAASILVWSQPAQGAAPLTGMSLEELMDVPVMNQAVSSVS